MARVRIFHNVSRDASFGLNMVFTREGKRFAEGPEERHPLVPVFEYTVDTGATYNVNVLLEQAFERFNIGSDELAAQYRARRLRSLSVGDVVEVDGSAYSCESAGWDPCHPDDMRVVDVEEAERLIRLRYDFGPLEDLAITVPLPSPHCQRCSTALRPITVGPGYVHTEADIDHAPVVDGATLRLEQEDD
jgi:hypothetical protein